MTESSSDQSKQEKANASADKKATDHLANERTFLAWVRTSITIMSLGFVVARFGLWLERVSQLTSDSGSNRQAYSSGLSMPIGVGLLICGALLTVMASWHYRRVGSDIEAGKVEPAVWLVTFVSVIIAVLAVALVIHLLVSAR